MKEKDQFEQSYAILRSMIVSSIFSMLGYTSDEVKYGKSKHFKTLNEDWDHIYQFAPNFNRFMAYFLYSERFNQLYGANVLIELHKNLDDIIAVKMNQNKETHIYPTDVVQDIFQIASGFARSCLHPGEREDFGSWNFKMYKLFLCLEHKKPKRTKLDLYKTEIAFSTEKSDSELIHIIRYGYKVAYNKQLPLKIDNEICFHLNHDMGMINALSALSREINSDETLTQSKLHQAFISSQPITEQVYTVNTIMLKSILLIDFVKFIVDDPRLTKVIDRILYK